MNKPILLAGVASLSLALAPAAYAEPNAAMVESYLPADFSQYGPRTAFDMVSQVPGFSIQEDENSGERGFGQASGNVLINGQRISGKSLSIRGALSRIPAAQVVGISVMDGAQLDVPGLSGRVANVVTGEASKITGTYGWQFFTREGLKPAPFRADLSVSGSKGALDWNVELRHRANRMGNAGTELVYDAAETLIEKRKEDYTHVASEPSIALGLAWKPESGHVGNLNVSYSQFLKDDKEISRRFPVNGLEGRRLYLGSEDEWNAEIGGDYALDIGPGRFKAIGLVRRENSPFVTGIFSGSLTDTRDHYDTRFDQTEDEGEYIARGEYSINSEGWGDWQLAVEGAFNYLESDAELSQAFGGAALRVIPLPGASTRVEETRMEALLTHGRRWAPNWFVQASLGAEVSEISQTGDVNKTRQFTRPKGFVQASWDQSDSRSFVFRLEREVGQLDFSDFVSSVNFEEEQDSAGNEDIVPHQSWVLSAEVEQKFSDWGSITAKLTAEDITDIVDLVPIGTSEGPGNIDAAKRYSASVRATVKLDDFGIPGGRFRINAKAQQSEVMDALTGYERFISNDLVSEVGGELRQDIPNTDWTYGVRSRVDRKAATYYLNSIDRQRVVPAFMFGFVEHKDVYGLTARVEVGNWLNARLGQSREFYDNSRISPQTGRQIRDRGFGPIFAVGIRGTF
ncbi:MAG: hypothetical protein ACRBEQ_13850 [Hyphomonas sp.]